jgi:hypothetical protein
VKALAHWCAFLTAACASDEELRSQVEAMLAASAQTDELLDRPAYAAVPELFSIPDHQSKLSVKSSDTRSNSKANSTKPNHLKVKTKLKAGELSLNHNQTMARSLKVKKNVKDGSRNAQHNQTVARPAKGLRVKSDIKAGIAWGGPAMRS